MGFWKCGTSVLRDFGKIGFRENGILGIWDFWILENGIFGKWDFGNMGSRENGTLRNWDYVKKGLGEKWDFR